MRQLIQSKGMPILLVLSKIGCIGHAIVINVGSHLAEPNHDTCFRAFADYERSEVGGEPAINYYT
jgi:hypothetical protein